MTGRLRDRLPKGSPFSWTAALWTVVLAAATYGLSCLRDRRILSEEQLFLVIFIAVPVAAFILSGKGQDQTVGDNETGRD